MFFFLNYRDIKFKFRNRNMVRTLLVCAVLGVGSALLLALGGVYWYWYMKRAREHHHHNNQLLYEEM